MGFKKYLPKRHFKVDKLYFYTIRNFNLLYLIEEERDNQSKLLREVYYEEVYVF